MKARGVHLQYRFEADGQRGAELENPLFELLSGVREHGSIRHAATARGASYRHVWGAIKHWESVLGEPLVTWTQGQPARLTPFAERLVWAETRARTRLTPHIEALRAELARVLSDALDGTQHVLTIFASHDLALPLLREQASARHGLHIELRFAGSVDALHALAQGRCLVAGFHVPPLQGAAPMFARAMKPLLRPGRHKLIGCLRRTQGLMVARANPLRIHGLTDLPGSAARFINRQPGSGTRLLIDQMLQQHGIDAASIRGYAGHPEDSHVAVAAAIASGVGDVGPGIESAAQQFGLGFIPLVEEDYFLVCLKDALDHPAVLKLRAALEAPGWSQALATLPGYEAAQGGEVLALTKALPWWNYRTPRASRRAQPTDHATSG